ncbi:hypothetical protein HYPSUDRAFT_209985, partial [Hypholoma sublateritium FD-334 SS-4]
MDVSPRPSPPRPAPPSPAPALLLPAAAPSTLPAAAAAAVPQTNAHLAQLLAAAYHEVETLRCELAAARRGTEKADRISHILAVAQGSASAPTADGTTPPPTTPPIQLVRLAAEYEDRLAAAERQRDDADARRRDTLGAFRTLGDFLASLDTAARSARAACVRWRAGEDSPPFVLPPLPAGLAVHVAGGSPGTPRESPTVHARTPSGASSIHPAQARMEFMPPPHPVPGARRARLPSMEGYASPPSKRAPGGYSESYIPALHVPQAEDRADYAHLARPTRPLSTANTHGGCGVPTASNTPTTTTSSTSAHVTNVRIISYGASRSHSPSPSHSRAGSCSSASSMDVDEMIIKASAGEDHAGGHLG